MELLKNATIVKDDPNQGVRAGDTVVILDRVEAKGRVGYIFEATHYDPPVVGALDEDYFRQL